jgi:serine/threonine protein kinase
MKRFCTFNHPCLSPIVYCCDPIAWKSIEESARIEERGRANCRKIANFLVTFCDHLLKAVGISEVGRHACNECQNAIREFQIGSNLDRSLIVENATRNLHEVLCSDPRPRMASTRQFPARSFYSHHPILIASGPGKSSMPASSLIPERSSMSISAWVTSCRITRLPADLFKDRKAVKASSKVLNDDRSRFGPVQEVMLTRDSSRFAAKYFQYFEESELQLSEYRVIMKRFCTFNHPCLSPIVYCCDPIPGNGPILVSNFYPRYSVQSLLEITSEKSGLTSTIKSMFICELVCGLFYLHSEQVIHGQLRPCKLLLDDDFHLHISGFTTTSLLGAKVVYSDRVGIANYAAPEVFEGADTPNSTFEGRSKVDIYSLGFIMYELFGNANWAEDLGPGEIARRARENLRPALPGGINVRLGNLISRCWDSDPDKRPIIEAVLHEMASMRFQFVSDVDCASVVKRALAVGPSDLITASLPAAVPQFETTPDPDKKSDDSENPNGSDHPDGHGATLPFGRVMRILIDYFHSLHLDSKWNPVDKWRDIFLEEGPAKVQEVTEPDWTKIANFIIQCCTFLLTAVGVPEPFLPACGECRTAVRKALSDGDQNLSSIVEAAARELHSAIPPHRTSCDSSLCVGEVQTPESVTATAEEPGVQNSGECNQRRGMVADDMKPISGLLPSVENVSGIMADQSPAHEGWRSGEVADPVGDSMVSSAALAEVNQNVEDGGSHSSDPPH